MPSLQTWLQAIDTSDLNLESDVIALRNHHYPVGGLEQDPTSGRRGVEEMITAIENWYPKPQNSGLYANFSSWCHTSQIFQADYYKSQIQFYRRGSAFPERNLGLTNFRSATEQCLEKILKSAVLRLVKG